ncbi:photosystem II reaction center protein PsbH [Pleurocapsales cyanobacterium LEGE 10410]|nr:photosystem II reaction center protein PsbH [Pleurocapsales cyanobacterium LEGE 10410]
MTKSNFASKKTAPLQYFFKSLNTEAGRVTRGWGTTPLMAGIIALFILFLLIITQIVNASILLEGMDVDWTSLN